MRTTACLLLLLVAGCTDVMEPAVEQPSPDDPTPTAIIWDDGRLDQVRVDQDEPTRPDEAVHEIPNTCINADDALAISPGSALGTRFSGQYEIVSGFLRSCEVCEQNAVADPCADVSQAVEEGLIGLITQASGVLTFAGSSEELVGGIDDDGSFSIGTVTSATDTRGEIVRQVLVLFEGRFVDDRILVDAVFHVTAGKDDKVTDYEFVNEVVYKRVDSRTSQGGGEVDQSQGGSEDNRANCTLFIDASGRVRGRRCTIN